MDKQIKITIENRLLIGKRDMNVYHYSTRSAHLISCDSSVTLPLGSTIENDYLHIAIVGGPGPLEGDCLVNLPSWIDFEFFSSGDVAVVHSGARILVKIPPGYRMWEIKLTRSLCPSFSHPSDRVTIGYILK